MLSAQTRRFFTRFRCTPYTGRARCYAMVQWRRNTERASPICRVVSELASQPSVVFRSGATHASKRSSHASRQGRPGQQRPQACFRAVWCQKNRQQRSKRNTFVPDAPSSPKQPLRALRRRRAPRDRASSAAAVHANWLPSTTRRRARCRGTVATATRTTSTHIPSRSRSHKWQP